MGTIVTVNNVQMNPIEIGGERVITLSMIDKVHGRPEGTARKRFNENRSRLAEGKHYFVRKTDEARGLGITAPNGLTVLTERGYLMLVKAFTDDLAWQVQDALVESYFTKATAPSTAQVAHADVSREYRLTMQQNVRWAKMAGLDGNQALLAANRATIALTGIDTLGLLGVQHMQAPQNAALLSPTEIGSRAELGSARAVNMLLCSLGFQSAFRDTKGHVYYEPTEAGIAAGGVMQDTGRKHSSGTPVRQLRWASSIIDHLVEPEAAAA